MAPKKSDVKKPEDEGPKVYVQITVSWEAALLVQLLRLPVQARLALKLVQTNLYADTDCIRRGIQRLLYLSW